MQMKKQTLVITADDLVRPTKKAQPLRKQSKKLQAEKQKLWEEELEATILQFEHGQILELSFKQAVQLLELAFNPKIIDQSKLTPKQEFENAFELYELAKGQAAQLEKQGITIMGDEFIVDPKWYDLTKKDLFEALSPEIQDLLRKHGVNYD
jgi:hypothetical protein